MNDDDSIEMNSDDEGNNNDDPIISLESIPVSYSINRIRSMNKTPIVATWNENG